MNQEDTIKLVNLIFDIAFREKTLLEITLGLFEFPKEYRNVITKTITSRIQSKIK